MKNHVDTFPSGALLLVNPVTKEALDMQPLLEHLHDKYDGNKAALVEELNFVADYMMRPATNNSSADSLREVFNTVRTLAAAFDSITVRKIR